MVKIFFAIFLIGGLLQSAMATGSESFLLGAVENLPTSLRIVKTCGNWQYGQQEGYYRLIIGDVHNGAGSEVYVQFITNPDQNTASKLIKTLAFSELNNDHSQYYFQSIDCSTVGKFTYVNVTGQYEHDEIPKMHHISIKLIDMNHYQLVEKKK